MTKARDLQKGAQIMLKNSHLQLELGMKESFEKPSWFQSKESTLGEFLLALVAKLAK